jgi:hypothetical protein
MKFINLRASRILFLLLAVSCVCLGASEPTAQGQTCTTTNSAPVDKTGWVRGQTVTVYIDPGIQGDARRGVEQAFGNR